MLHSQPEDDDVTVLDVHSGSAFRDTSDNKYDTHAKVIYEAVQNALNAEATEIWVVIDYRNKAISIRDNGIGVTVADFNEVLKLKGMRGFSKGMGYFNLGFTSALGKCQILQFTSKAKQHDAPFVRWTFDSTEIFESRVGVEIPRETLGFSFSRSPRSESEVNWRSSYEMINLIFSDSGGSRPKPKGKVIRDYCIKSFREAMIQNGTKMHIKEIDAKGKTVYAESFVADAFKGKKLKDWKASKPKTTRVELYLSGKTGKKYTGQGVTAHRLQNKFGVDVGLLLKQCSDSDLLDSKDLVAAFSSGMFEGKIESALLELLPDRKTFRQNDDLLEFLIHLQQWWEEVGMDHYEKVRNDESSELFAKCAKDAQEKLKKIAEEFDATKLLESKRKPDKQKPEGPPGFETDPNGDEIQEDGGTGTYDKPGGPTGGTTVCPVPGPYPGGAIKPPVPPRGGTGGNIKNTGNTKPSGKKSWDLKLVESTDLDAETPWFISNDRRQVLVNIEHHYYTRVYENRDFRQKRVVEYQMKILFQALSLVTSDFEPADEFWQNTQSVLFQELFLEVLSITG